MRNIIITKEENNKWYDENGNIIAEFIDGFWTSLPEYEYDNIDYSLLLKNGW